jgi:hypothetical protein
MADFGEKLLTRARLAKRAVRFVVREPQSALTALRMAVWVAALSLFVKWMPLPRALALIAPRTRRSSSPADASSVQLKLAQLLDSVLAADFWIFTPTCWKRAPVLHRFLALRGIETRVVFGVRREGEETLSGHAWLEAGGEPLLENTPPKYLVTYSFPQS